MHQPSLFETPPPAVLVEHINALDPDSLSPPQALGVLYALQKLLDNIDEPT